MTAGSGQSGVDFERPASVVFLLWPPPDLQPFLNLDPFAGKVFRGFEEYMESRGVSEAAGTLPFQIDESGCEARPFR